MVFIAAVVVLFFFFPKKKVTTGEGGPAASTATTTGGGDVTIQPILKLPVYPSSSNPDILAAFKQSGYFAQLSPQQQQEAAADPSGWLNGHPYLYIQYPAYFTYTGSPPPSVVDYLATVTGPYGSLPPPI